MGLRPSSAIGDWAKVAVFFLTLTSFVVWFAYDHGRVVALLMQNGDAIRIIDGRQQDVLRRLDKIEAIIEVEHNAQRKSAYTLMMEDELHEISKGN